MVQRAESDNKWNVLPSKNDMALRRVSAIVLIAALLSIMIPFAPFSWVIYTDGTDMLDRFLAPPLVLGALYTQWQISGRIMLVVVEIGEVAFVYRQTMYWWLALAEFGLCAAVLLLGSELLRRAVVAVFVAGLWAVGWKVAPERFKREAWEHLKMIWLLMAFGEASRMTNGRRRRW